MFAATGAADANIGIMAVIAITTVANSGAGQHTPALRATPLERGFPLGLAVCDPRLRGVPDLSAVGLAEAEGRGVSLCFAGRKSG